MSEFKITVIGDIMAEPPVVEGAKTADGYDFTNAFGCLKPMLDEADYAIGNLETPLAGEEAGYTSRLVSFNAPVQIAKDLKACGIDMVSTANNHALDRGYAGLVKTIEALDELGIGHTGTYADGEKNRIFYFTLGDTRFAVIAYTHSTNYGINLQDPTEEGHQGFCNYLMPIRYKSTRRPEPMIFLETKKMFEGVLERPLIWEESVRLRTALGITNAYSDDIFDENIAAQCFENVKKDYEEARKNADIVFFYPHSGGQFNPQPGRFSSALMRRAMALGFDAVFCAHSHTTQKAEVFNGKPYFYSMGNVTMSPNTIWSVPESMPEYGLAAHVYIKDKKVEKTTFSIIKMVEDEDHPMRSIPVDVLYGMLEDEESKAKLVADVAAIYNRVAGKTLLTDVIQKEYLLG